MAPRLMAFLLVALCSMPSWAGEDHEKARQLLEEKRIVPLEQIIDHARKLHTGRLLEAEFEQNGQRYIYEIEWVDVDGVVWEMKYDANTGQLIKEEKDH